MSSPARQYTIRGIPDDVDLVLRDRAKKRRVSLNQQILDELTKATVGQRKFRDLSDLVGKWCPDPEFDKAVESQRVIDPEDWT